MLGFDFFKGKKVTVMGLGLLGRGVGDVAFIAESGAREVIVTDLKTAEELKSSVEKLAHFSNLKFVLGEHREEDFIETDMVLVAAGVPLHSRYLKLAEEANVPKFQSAALFAEISKVPIIGVTGSRGKSTVTHLIHHVLKTVTGEEVLLGGNIRGVSNLQLLKEVKADSLGVMELDSWQLQGFGWQKSSPQIAVFTNFMEDHLNYYQAGDLSKEQAMELYFKDKAQIFLHQTAESVFVTTPQILEWIKKVFPNWHGEQEVVLVDDSTLPETFSFNLPGEHNRLNAALAFAALKALSLTEEEIEAGLVSFSGVEGRLQYLGATLDGVAIFNDNNATTPQATIAGLKALGVEDKKQIVLIAGGADKNISLTELVAVVEKYCSQVILLKGSGTDKFMDAWRSQASINPKIVTSLEEAVETAFSLAKTGDTVLFSPAFASFGLFKNEYERNDEFVRLIEERI